MSTEAWGWRQRKRLVSGMEATGGVLVCGAGQYRFVAREMGCGKVALSGVL